MAEPRMRWIPSTLLLVCCALAAPAVAEPLKGQDMESRFLSDKFYGALVSILPQRGRSGCSGNSVTDDYSCFHAILSPWMCWAIR